MLCKNYLPVIEDIKYKASHILGIPPKLISVINNEHGSENSWMINITKDEFYCGVNFEKLSKLNKEYNVFSIYSKNDMFSIHISKRDWFDKTIGRLLHI